MFVDEAAVPCEVCDLLVGFGEKREARLTIVGVQSELADRAEGILPEPWSKKPIEATINKAAGR